MNTNINTNNTVDNILNQAKLDKYIIKLLRRTEDTNDSTLCDSHLGQQALSIVNYMKENLWLNMTEFRHAQKLGDFTKYCLVNVPDRVKVHQMVANPYFFTIEASSCRSIVLPLLMTRNTLFLLKSLGIRIICEKYDREVMSVDKRMLLEICFKGKSTDDMHVFKLVSDIAKKIKLSINPWSNIPYTEEEDNNDISEASVRFRGAPWFKSAQQNVTLIGCGGLGSNIAVSLCRVLGDHIIRLYDADYVEQKNLAGQNFGINDIGLLKCNVVSEQCRNFNPLIEAMPLPRMYSASEGIIDNVVITGLDNMATRALVYSKWMQRVESDEDIAKRSLLIDARLSAETWQILCVARDDKKAQKEYENNWLFTDDEADEGVCSYKQTAFAAQMCASFVTNLYINFCFNLTLAKDDPHMRYLPFLTEYDASQMLMRYKNID